MKLEPLVGDDVGEFALPGQSKGDAATPMQNEFVALKQKAGFGIGADMGAVGALIDKDEDVAAQLNAAVIARGVRILDDQVALNVTTHGEHGLFGAEPDLTAVMQQAQANRRRLGRYRRRHRERRPAHFKPRNLGGNGLPDNGVDGNGLFVQFDGG